MSSSAMAKLAAAVAMRLQVKRVHRIRINTLTLTQGATTNVNLLICDDDPDYDLATDGTSVAECQPGARIVAIQLVMSMVLSSTGEVVEWIVGRDPDAFLNTNFTMAELYAADVTANRKLLRANVWGAGHFHSSTNRDMAVSNLNITKALRRARLMADGDVIRLAITCSANASDFATLYLRGRIITRGP